MRSKVATRAPALAAWAAVAALAATPARAAAKSTHRIAVARLGEAYRAYEADEFTRAAAIARRIDLQKLVNVDYALFVQAQSAYFTGDVQAALAKFRALAGMHASRFRDVARWRVADCLWRLGRASDAAAVYAQLLHGVPGGDPAVAQFRIAEAHARAGDTQGAISGFQAFRRNYPDSPLAPRAEKRLVDLGGSAAATLSPQDRIARAQALISDHLGHRAAAELATIGHTGDANVARLRDYWTAKAYYSLRRRYHRAGKLLLAVYKGMGDHAAEAMFHGARALSRADLDQKAVGWYRRVVAEYPHSHWADDAAFLAGWLEYNDHDYRRALPLLAKMRHQFPHSRWIDETIWYEGFCHYLLGEYNKAIPLFEKLSHYSGRLRGGKGDYWLARSLQKLGRTAAANQAYRALVGRFPFSWYALLAAARLREQHIRIGPFGDKPASPDDAPPLDHRGGRRLARTHLIRVADELIDAGLKNAAGIELHRGERAFIRHHSRAAALAALLDRYHRAGNYNRPWELAIVYGGHTALNAPPRGRARVWWKYAYPLAYHHLVERWRHLGKDPKYYLYAIMRKESGFDPNVQSYADARGLLQMIPPTTRRVVKALHMRYTDDLLFTPAGCVKTGAWYIGRLLQKFRGQIPVGAGSFNAGPRAEMKWLHKNGTRPMDEFVEFVSYTQTRGYMKKVTETYARYLYLYRHVIYRQPLEVNAHYIENSLTY